MQLQASRHSADNDFVNYSQSPPAPVSFGTDAASEPWTIDVSTVGVPNQQLISWQWDVAGFGSIADDAAKIQTAVDGGRTYVLADLPRAVARPVSCRSTVTGSILWSCRSTMLSRHPTERSLRMHSANP